MENPTSQEQSSEYVIHGRTGTYHLLEEIGRGAYGVVHKGIEIETGFQIAAKRAARSRLSGEEEMAVHSEINLLRQLHHEHIVRYIEAVRSEKYLDILMELVEGGSLYCLLKSWMHSMKKPAGPNNRVFPEEMVAKYVRQVLLGLNYLHEQGIVHRDIKSANLLTTKNSIVKLADFGVSIVGEGPKGKDGSVDGMNVAGTPYWMAPEVVSLTAASTASDIWSLGCTVIELLTGAPPYFHLSDITAMFRIVSDDCPPLPTDLSTDAEDFLRRCFVKDMAARATAGELLKHRWIRQDSDVNVSQLSAESFGMEVADGLESSEANADAGGLDLACFQEDEGEDLDLELPDIASVSLSADDETPLSPKFPVQPNGTPSTTFMNDESSTDPFMEVPTDLEAERERDRVRHQQELWHRVKSAVTSLSAPETSNEACEILIDVFSRHSEQRYNVIHDPGLLPILEVLEGENRGEEEITNVLRVIVAIVTGEEGGIQSEHHTSLGYPAVSNVCEDLCMAGFLPAIAEYSQQTYPMKVRVEAAKVVEKILEDEHTMRMFIACHGFKSIVNMLEPDLARYRDLVSRALDAIRNLLSMQNQRYKRDFCRRFAYCGLLERVVKGIVENVKDPATGGNLLSGDEQDELDERNDSGLKLANERARHVVRLANLLMTFAARADGMVKERMASKSVISPIVAVLREGSLPKAAIDPILACLRDISRDPGTHGALEEARVIQTLIPQLAAAELTRCVAIISTLHNLCIVSRARQQVACRSGLIAYLIQFIRSDDTMSLKSLCIDIYSGLAAAGPGCRNELWRHGGVDFYVELLEMLSVEGTVRKWQARVLKSLSQWLDKDGASRGVESRLIQPHNIEKISKSIAKMHLEDVEQILEPYHGMVSGSIAVTEVLGKRKDLMTSMIRWIQRMYDTQSRPRGRLLIVRTLFWHAKHWDMEMKAWASKGPLADVLRRTIERAHAVTVKRQATAFLKMRETW